jgi:hypothetical protein
VFPLKISPGARSDRVLGLPQEPVRPGSWGFSGCRESGIQRARVQNHGCRRAGAGETGYELGLTHRFVHKSGRWHHRMLDAWLVPLIAKGVAL